MSFSHSSILAHPIFHSSIFAHSFFQPSILAPSILHSSILTHSFFHSLILPHFNICSHFSIHQYILLRPFVPKFCYSIFKFLLFHSTILLSLFPSSMFFFFFYHSLFYLLFHLLLFVCFHSSILSPPLSILLAFIHSFHSGSHSFLSLIPFQHTNPHTIFVLLLIYLIALSILPSSRLSVLP